MKCPARFTAATIVIAVAPWTLSTVSKANGAQLSLPSALASFLTEDDKDEARVQRGAPMIPVHEASRTPDSLPLVTVSLIAVNVLAFIWEVGGEGRRR